MSDTKVYYEQMRGRARRLVTTLDDAMTEMMSVELAVNDVLKGDMDNPGELSTTDGADLRQLLETAQFSLRAAERIAVEHSTDIGQAMKRLGLLPEKDEK